MKKHLKEQSNDVTHILKFQQFLQNTGGRRKKEVNTS